MRDPHVHTPSTLDSLGWDSTTAAWLATTAQPGDQPGRVVRVERGGLYVAQHDGVHLVPTDPRAAAVGDWVTLRWQGEHPALTGVAPRHSQLTRLDPEGLTLVLAANIDLVLIAAPADRLSPARIERETAAAWASGATPIVLLTKNDLAPPGLAADLTRRLIGVDVVQTSTVTGDGVEQVHQALLPNRTAVLLGPSGAGKSSLANALLGEHRLATGDVRADDRRGRHTTTSRHLLAVPGGGVLIDTPGLRSFALAGDEGIAATFPDIENLAADCRFADCRHDGEPGCAVADALATGDIDPARLASYQKLHKQMAYEARRDDPVAQRENERQWKIIARAQRQHYKQRPR